MLTSSALVLMMTGPGLALFYGGLVRKKNVLGTMMQSFALMAVITILWALFSYSLSFGPGNSFIGGFQNLFLNGVGSAPDADYAATIPAQTFMVYQLMFAIITPGLIAGAFAERMKFSAMLVFMILWSIIVYDPDGAHGLGQGRPAECLAGRAFPDSRFCRRHRRSHHVGSLGAGLRVVLGQAPRIPQAEHAAAQRRAQLHRRVPAVGGMVRIQCRQRAGSRQSGHERIRSYSFRVRRGGCGVGGGGMDPQRASRACLAEFPVRWQDWWPSRPRRGS